MSTVAGHRPQVSLLPCGSGRDLCGWFFVLGVDSWCARPCPSGGGPSGRSTSTEAPSRPLPVILSPGVAVLSHLPLLSSLSGWVTPGCLSGVPLLCPTPVPGPETLCLVGTTLLSDLCHRCSQGLLCVSRAPVAPGVLPVEVSSGHDKFLAVIVESVGLGSRGLRNSDSSSGRRRSFLTFWDFILYTPVVSSPAVRQELSPPTTGGGEESHSCPSQ